MKQSPEPRLTLRRGGGALLVATVGATSLVLASPKPTNNKAQEKGTAVAGTAPEHVRTQTNELLSACQDGSKIVPPACYVLAGILVKDAHIKEQDRIVLDDVAIAIHGSLRVAHKAAIAKQKEAAATTTTTTPQTTTTSTSTTTVPQTTTTTEQVTTTEGGSAGTSGTPPASGSLAVWLEELRDCESGGNYAENTGNGFYGAYQFSESTWESLGAPYSGYSLPSEAPPAMQDAAIVINTDRSGGGLATQNPGCYEKTGISAFPPS